MNQIDVDITADQTSGQEDQRLVRVVEEYRALLEAGQKPERRPFLERCPDLAPALNDCFDGLEFVFTVAPAMRAPAEKTSVAPGPGALPAAVPLGDYKIVREIGRGGMGVVYEAEQMLLGRRVALKVLPFAATMDSRQLQRFQNEARAAACLHHPHIVPIYAVGCERGVHFYAMQFIEGQSLAEVIADLRLQNADFRKKGNDGSPKPVQPGNSNLQSEIDNLKSGNLQSTIIDQKSATQLSTRAPGYFQAVARLGTQAAQALHHAHDLGVIHRDIKPANLMLDGGGNLWVTDFGLAQIQGDVQLTMTGDLVGTMRYMSPEQALAKRVLVDHRTDIYSLGATLYELVTLEPVFTGGDRQELLRQIAFEDPKPPRRHNKSISAELETIVLKALEKNPADRYATAQELADDLERFSKNEPIWARRPSLKRRLGHWCRRHKLLVTGILAIVFTAALLGAATLLTQERRRAVVELAVVEDLKEVEFWQKQEQWAKAMQALERAKGRLEESGAEPLQALVEKRRQEINLVAKLDKARLKTALGTPFGKGDNADAVRAFEEIFADQGLKLGKDNAEETSRRVRASSVARQLVAALDYWAYVKDRLPGGNGEDLRAIARLADDDKWRQGLRSLGRAKDPQALERLVADKDILAQPPANLLLLSYCLQGAAQEQLLLRAQLRYPGDFWINFSLGTRYKSPDQIPFLRVAQSLQPNNSEINALLGLHLWDQNRLAEAEVAYNQALILKPDNFEAHYYLGQIWFRQNKLPEAASAFQNAVRLKPDDFEARVKLGNALRNQQKYAEAEAAYDIALKIKPNFARALYHRGIAFYAQEKLAEAEAAFRKVIALANYRREYKDYKALGSILRWDMKLPEAYFHLGNVLQKQGDQSGAAKAYRIAHQLDRFLLQRNHFYATTARFLSDDFAGEPKLAEDIWNGYRYNAACAAALAGCGQGNDAPKQDAKESARLRDQARAWLRADLPGWRSVLEKDADKAARIEVRPRMEHWLTDPDFDGVRDATALANLPEAERQEWRKLWEEVEQLRQRATQAK